MKIYLAATAPGTEGTKEIKALDIHHRLLSYYLIVSKTLISDKVFKIIVKVNRKG